MGLHRVFNIDLVGSNFSLWPVTPILTIVIDERVPPSASYFKITFFQVFTFHSNYQTIHGCGLIFADNAQMLEMFDCVCVSWRLSDSLLLHVIWQWTCMLKHDVCTTCLFELSVEYNK